MATDLEALKKVASVAKKAASAAARFLTSPVKVVVEKTAIAQIEKLIGSASKSQAWVGLKAELVKDIKRCNEMAAKFKKKMDENAFTNEFLAFGSDVKQFVARCQKELKLDDATVEKINKWLAITMFVDMRTLAKKYPDVFQRMARA